MKIIMIHSLACQLSIHSYFIANNHYEHQYFSFIGGWAVGTCRHGIVYCIKNLLRSESPRDYIDLQRSLKHRPNIAISDVAHLVASLGNKTVPGFFGPNEGRLATATEENITKAEAGEKFHAPFLVEPEQDFDPNDQDTNPCTGSRQHLSLYDVFHEGNCKKRTEILRRSSLLKEITGIVDTQAVEQTFSSCKKDIYFLNNLTPTNHMFVVRLIFHLRNKQKNNDKFKQQSSIFKSLSTNDLGQITENYNSAINIKNLKNTTNPKENLETVTENARSHQSPCKSVIGNDSLHATTPFKPGGNISDIPRTNNLENEITFMKECLTASFASFQHLTTAEQTALRRNQSYVDTVLFRSASTNRSNQVRTTETHLGRFQTQGHTNYCGLCALNNAVLEANPFTIDELNLLADELWVSMLNDPSHGPVIPVEPMRDREGFYSVEVLQSALRRRGYEMLQVNPMTLFNVQPPEVGRTIINELISNFGVCTLIVRLARHAHWISIRADESTSIIMDSKAHLPRVISYNELGWFLHRNLSNPGAVYFIIQEEDNISIITAEHNEETFNEEDISNDSMKSFKADNNFQAHEQTFDDEDISNDSFGTLETHIKVPECIFDYVGQDESNLEDNVFGTKEFDPGQKYETTTFPGKVLDIDLSSQESVTDTNGSHKQTSITEPPTNNPNRKSFDEQDEHLKVKNYYISFFMNISYLKLNVIKINAIC